MAALDVLPALTREESHVVASFTDPRRRRAGSRALFWNRCDGLASPLARGRPPRLARAVPSARLRIVGFSQEVSAAVRCVSRTRTGTPACPRRPVPSRSLGARWRARPRFRLGSETAAVFYPPSDTSPPPTSRRSVSGRVSSSGPSRRLHRPSTAAAPRSSGRTRTTARARTGGHVSPKDRPQLGELDGVSLGMTTSPTLFFLFALSRYNSGGIDQHLPNLSRHDLHIETERLLFDILEVVADLSVRFLAGHVVDLC